MKEKEKLLLDYMLSSVDVYALCKSIIDPAYFVPELRNAVKFINQYYDQYSALPNAKQVFAETKVQLDPQPITSDQLKYCATEMEAFCKQKALDRAIVEAAALIDTGDYGKINQLIRDAQLVSLDKDIGIDYFSNPLERLQQQASQPLKIPTNYTLIDDILGGGIARKEVVVFLANSGGGKSLMLANLAIQYLHQGLSVVYISLELSEEMIAQRLDVMFTGIPTVSAQQKYHDIAASLEAISHDMERLVIKRMPADTTNANHIRSYLKEYELKYGRVPDVLIVDYLDLLGSIQRVSADAVWEKDKRASQELREITHDYNLIGLTASQMNRGAVDATEYTQAHIAGGISKINTVDVVAAINLSPHMKAQGEIGIQFLKTRSSDGVGKTVFLKWNNNRLRIENPTQPSKQRDVIIDTIQQNSNKPGSKKSLLDLYDDLDDN